MTLLKKLYLVQESIDAARKLWNRRIEQDKYGSVGFSCYGHYVKGTGKSPRGSIMGPCIQAVNLTYLNDRRTSVDIYYRTTELFKKFPADLILIRDEFLPQFNIHKLHDVTFHFANVTCHPMYAVTFFPFIDPIKWLKKVRVEDPFFHTWLVKWSARYVCPEYSNGIQKFSQALRVQKDALERIDKETLKDLREYFRKHHPGIKGKIEDEGEDE